MLFDSRVDDACTSDSAADDDEGLAIIIIGGVLYLVTVAFACWSLFRMASGI